MNQRKFKIEKNYSLTPSLHLLHHGCIYSAVFIWYKDWIPVIPVEMSLIQGCEPAFSNETRLQLVQFTTRQGLYCIQVHDIYKYTLPYFIPQNIQECITPMKYNLDIILSLMFWPPCVNDVWLKTWLPVWEIIEFFSHKLWHEISRSYLLSIKVHLMLLFFNRAKQKEIEAGADGFMVYDIRLVEPAQQVYMISAW